MHRKVTAAKKKSKKESHATQESNTTRRDAKLLRGDAAELVEVGWEGLGGALGIENGHGHAGAGGEGEGHGDAVVVVGFDADVGVRLVLGGRGDDAVGVALEDVGAEFGGFGDDGLHALRFFDAPGADVADGRRTFRYQRNGREGHGGVGDVEAVDVDAAQWSVGRYRYVGRLHVYRRTHLCEDLGEADVALSRLGPAADHRHGPAGHRRRREKVRRRARVAFDEVTASQTLLRIVALTRRHREGLQRVVVRHLDAEAAHQVDREEDVRCGNEFVDDGDLDVLRLRQKRRRQ
mmetsp:Transcript_6852/g.21243  ORF Transcript_6852/g.21243 Transcript_6852/m.21243 type:complete len:292 (-) Transcript_6852:328-1203(-)